MSAVQITGCSGAGKSTIAGALARRDMAAIDADEDPWLARMVDAAGNVVDEPDEPDLAWLARHRWAWNPARLDELIQAVAPPATLYVCGGADNELEMADRFAQVFLLEIDEPTMLARLDARRDYHDWGRVGDTREYLRRKLPELQDRLRASGAIPIDARQPLGQVVDAILSRVGQLHDGPGQQAEQSARKTRQTLATVHHSDARQEVFLSDSDYKRVDEACGLLAEKGTELAGPSSDHLEGPVWELRDGFAVLRPG